MENLEVNPQPEPSFISDKTINSYLMETAKWGNFLAIVGYVFMGILILIGLFMLLGASFMNQATTAIIPLRLLAFIYLLLTGAYFFPVTYLYRYSARIKHGLKTKDIEEVTYAFENLKSLFKFFGIFTIVCLVLYGLMMFIAIPAGMLLGH